MSVSIVRRNSSTHDLPADLHPVIAKVYASRNLRTPNELERSLRFLHSYESLKNIDSAVELLSDAVQLVKKVLIVADFDETVRALQQKIKRQEERIAVIVP